VGFLDVANWLRQAPTRPFALLTFYQDFDKSNGVYNILWAVVFGFATINILGLVSKRFEPTRTRLSFGEVLAIMVVVVSAGLLCWEMLFLFHILPIKLQPR
jgi:hypothetical protein